MTRRRAPTYLYWDKDRGAWYLRFRYVDAIGRVHWPRERSPSPGAYRASLSWAANRRLELIAEIDADVRDASEPAPVVTLRQVMDTYEADAIARGTRWKDEKPRAEIIVKTLGPATPAMELTPKRIATWRTKLREDRSRPDGDRPPRPLSNRSLNAYTTILQAALNYAASAEVELLPSNPLDGLHRLVEARRTPPALSDVQTSALLAALDPWEARETSRDLPAWARSRVPLRTRVLLGYWTGGRPEALDALTWAELDLRRGMLRYDAKEHRAIVVPLEPPLLAHLRERRRARKPAAGDLVMPGDTGGPVVNWRQAWDRLVEIANAELRRARREPIPDRTPIHVLRHTRISHLLQARVPPQVVAQITGTSIAMLIRHYAHLMTDALEEELSRARRTPVLRRIAAGGQKSGQTARPKTAAGDARKRTASAPKSRAVN